VFQYEKDCSLIVTKLDNYLQKIREFNQANYARLLIGSSQCSIFIQSNGFHVINQTWSSF